MSAAGHRAARRRVLGRYELHDELASGGMATVHLGRQMGLVGFSRPVAIKRLHEKYAKDQDFVAMFVDEARLASRVRHPNVVPTLDVVAAQGELFLVMEYVHGESIAKILRTLGQKKERIPIPIVAAIALDMLAGLHAAHEAKSERGEPLGIVHRDVSPQNVLVSSEGKAHVFDFGVATASQRTYSTEDGSLKGKMPYMPPEQLNGELVDRRADVWSAGVVVWEMLVGKRLFTAPSSAALVKMILENEIDPPSTRGIDGALDTAVLGALTKDREKRFQTARELAIAIESATTIATTRAVSEWIEATLGPELKERAERVEAMERDASRDRPSGQTRVELLGITSDSGEKLAVETPKAEDPPLDPAEVLATSTQVLAPPTPIMPIAPVPLSAPPATPRSLRPDSQPMIDSRPLSLPPPTTPPKTRVGVGILVAILTAFVVFGVGTLVIVVLLRDTKPALEPEPAMATTTATPPATLPTESSTATAPTEPSAQPATSAGPEPAGSEKHLADRTKKPPRATTPLRRDGGAPAAAASSTPRSEFGNGPW